MPAFTPTPTPPFMLRLRCGELTWHDHDWWCMGCSCWGAGRWCSVPPPLPCPSFDIGLMSCNVTWCIMPMFDHGFAAASLFVIPSHCWCCCDSRCPFCSGGPGCCCCCGMYFISGSSRWWWWWYCSVVCGITACMASSPSGDMAPLSDAATGLLPRYMLAVVAAIIVAARCFRKTIN